VSANKTESLDILALSTAQIYTYYHETDITHC